jgi:hypothetical protein
MIFKDFTGRSFWGVARRRWPRNLLEQRSCHPARVAKSLNSLGFFHRRGARW